MAPVLGNRAVPFLRKSARLTLGKWHGLCRTSATDLGKNCHRLQENQQPTLGKSATDFGKISRRLWGNPSPILGNSVTYWGNASPVLVSPALGKNWLGFGETLARFWGKTGSIWGKLFWFLNWLATKLKSHCFEREACLGLGLLFFKLGVSKISQPVEG